MSRKMMLLRSRTGSGMAVNGLQPQGATGQIGLDINRDTSALDQERETPNASFPMDQDAGNLAPETADSKRFSTSASSITSEDLAAIPSFLRKYEALGDTTDDEQGYGYSVTVEGGGEAQRKAQEEHNSAVLSKRAEEILANAKKRLNVRNYPPTLWLAHEYNADIVTANGRQPARCARPCRSSDCGKSKTSHLPRSFARQSGFQTHRERSPCARWPPVRVSNPARL